MRSFDRQFRKLLKQANAAIAERERVAAGGVVTLPHDEFVHACETWPMAGPGEIGVLLVPEQLTIQEWGERHSPQAPVHENVDRQEPDDHDCSELS